MVMIHGMGEQWPMETLRGFVEAAWTCDPDVVIEGVNDPIYSKPDAITGSFELRRITTRDWRGAKKRRVDFFEFYWAHLMQGNTLSAVIGWLLRLLVRPRSRVPDRLVGGWIAGLVLLAAVALFAALTAFKWAPEGRLGGVLWALIGFGGSLLAANWLVPVVGDAARYLSPAPGNVAVRQTIREAGIDLLAKLHASGDYDRIVVVGHSLGSVVGFDVLNYAWGRIAHQDLADGHPAGSPIMARLEALEALARALRDKPSRKGGLTAYRTAQRTYFDELSKLKGPSQTTGDQVPRPLWLVSDYITLGCPLSSSDVLLARDAEDLKSKKAIRDVPTSPPWLEEEPGKPPSFSYPAGAAARTPHHAAVFGPTVWTNVFFPSRLGVLGDFISGPVAPQLGPGVRDVRVPIGEPRFRHLDYWRDPKGNPPWMKALRRGINLRDRNEAMLWKDQVDSNPVLAEALSDAIAPAKTPAKTPRKPSRRRRGSSPRPGRPPPGSRTPG
ncbi:hypothetical protein [Phenylobacterium sp.]|uniref:hypothetical protein n=1 Tax=Phenylobacterium sp. TaxID=1871053 RepID=UPI0035656B57